MSVRPDCARHQASIRCQSIVKGIGSPTNSLKAFIAARCSASFLLLPQAGE